MFKPCQLSRNVRNFHLYCITAFTMLGFRIFDDSLQAERFERSEHGEAKRFEVEVREDRTKMKTPARVNVTPQRDCVSNSCGKKNGGDL